MGMLCVFCLLPANYAWAKTQRILIVSSGNSAAYTKVIDTLQATVASSAALSKAGTELQLSIFFLKSTSTDEELQRKLKGHDLLLTIGQRAMISATKINNSPPTLVTLIPEQSYLRHRATLRKINKQTSAIFIDNLPNRQILLAKILLGDVQKLGILIGENPAHGKKEIQSSIKKLGIKSHIETVKEKDSLIRKLSNVLNNSDTFLALPDAQIFNRDTAKHILLTTYRHRTPLIAYSASYVKAGALAAAYSTPQQIAEQAADTLIKIFSSKNGFPKQDSHPKHFEISINKNVAKSLGIPIPSESTVKKQLLEKLGIEK